MEHIEESEEMEAAKEQVEAQQLEQEEMRREEAIKIEESPEVDEVGNEPDVKGFENCEVMNDEEVREFLDEKIPDEHLEGLGKIEYKDQILRGDDGRLVMGEYEKPWFGDRQIHTYEQIDPAEANAPSGPAKEAGLPGDFSQDESLAEREHTIIEKIERNRMEDTLAHEVGHNAYDNLDPQTQSDWEAISGNRAPEDCVSDYATTNAQEDFAETYMEYVQDPEHLEWTNPDKYEFMRNRVFHDGEYEY